VSEQTRDPRVADEADRSTRHRTEVLLLVSALIVLGISALPALHGSSGAERTIFRWINDLPGVLYRPVAIVMELGNIVTVFIAAAIALLFRRFRLAFGLALAGSCAYLTAKLVKYAVNRGRPAALLDHVHEHGARAGGLGYVSGHAAVAFAVVAVATMWLGRRSQAALWVLAVGVPQCA
jgi:undecaprenyl-diphosphatase